MLDEWTPLRLMQEVSDVLKPLTVGAGPETLELQPSFSQQLTSPAQPQPNQYNRLLATPNTGVFAREPYVQGHSITAVHMLLVNLEHLIRDMHALKHH